jgi:hypothetical protein
MIRSPPLGRVSGSAPSGGTGRDRESRKAACSPRSSSLPLPARLPRALLDSLANYATLNVRFSARPVRVLRRLFMSRLFCYSLHRRVGVSCLCFLPRLDLVPRTFAQSRQRLRLHGLWIIHRRKSCRAQQRIRQRAILRPQPRHFFFQQLDIIRPPELLEYFQHNFEHTRTAGENRHFKRFNGLPFAPVRAERPQWSD